MIHARKGLSSDQRESVHTTISGTITDNEDQQSSKKRKKGTRHEEDCHQHTKSPDHIEKVLFNDRGQIADEDDICRFCNRPITIDQKFYMLDVLLNDFNERRRDLILANKSKLYVKNTFLGRSFKKWADLN